MTDPYEATEYEAPAMLSSMDRFISALRFHYSQNIADLLSSDKTLNKNYYYGLIIYASIMGTFFLLWATALLMFKWKGDSVGCASGKPFQTTLNEYSGESTQKNSSGSTEGVDEFTLSEGSGSGSLDAPNSESPVQAEEDPERIEQNIRRQRRTRFAFLGSAIINIVCCSLLLVYAFSPVRDTTDLTSDLFSESQDIIDQVNSAVRSITSAAEHAMTTVSSVNLNFTDFCPNVGSADELGVDLDQLAILMQQELDEIDRAVDKNITSVKRRMRQVQNGLDEIKTTVETSEDKLWVLPTIVLSVITVTTTAVMSLLIRWRGGSGKCFQRAFSHCLVPALILLSLVCWAAAIGSAIATAVGSDSCLAGDIKSPDGAIQNIMIERNINPESTLYRSITAYTGGCRGEEPTKELIELEAKISSTVDTIWRHVSTSDSIGREKLAEQCGNSVDGLMEGARNLARSLTLIRKSLVSATTTLKCRQIHPLYVEAVYDALCTDTVEASAYAYLLFSLVSICMMTMVSLRAALYDAEEEEKVFHESEIAENMVLDEHEEYLAYISKYKHEWQEYDGIRTGSIENSGEGSVEASLSGSWSGESVDGEDAPSSLDEESFFEEDRSYVEESVTDAPSYDDDTIATGDISFPSLQGEDPPSMLPPMGSEVDDDHAIIGLLPATLLAARRPSAISIPTDNDADEVDAVTSPFVDGEESSVESAIEILSTKIHGSLLNKDGGGEMEVEVLPVKSSLKFPKKELEVSTDKKDVYEGRDDKMHKTLITEKREEPPDPPGTPSRRHVGWTVDPSPSFSSPADSYLQNSKRSSMRERPLTPTRRRSEKIMGLATHFDQ